MSKEFPSFVIIQYVLSSQYPLLESRINNLSTIEPLAPFCQKGQRGTLDGIPVALYTGPAMERTLVPLLKTTGKFFFAIGLVGAVQNDITRGDILIPTASIRGEGLTQYYADKDFPAVMDLEATCALKNTADRLGVKVRSGVFYTTPSVYTEPEFLPKWQELGVIGIQMEIAQLFLLSHLYRKRATGIYGVSDSPVKGDEFWIDGITEDDILNESLKKAIDIALQAIQELDAKMEE